MRGEVCFEPTPEVSIFCCVRSQRGKCRESASSGAASQQENLPDLVTAAQRRRRIPTLRMDLHFWTWRSTSVFGGSKKKREAEAQQNSRQRPQTAFLAHTAGCLSYFSRKAAHYCEEFSGMIHIFCVQGCADVITNHLMHILGPILLMVHVVPRRAASNAVICHAPQALRSRRGSAQTCPQHLSMGSSFSPNAKRAYGNKMTRR